MSSLIGDVEALRIEPLRVSQIDRNGEWPCPFCRQMRSIKGAYAARVRNRLGEGHERWVRVCADCVATVPRVRGDVTSTPA